MEGSTTPWQITLKTWFPNTKLKPPLPNSKYVIRERLQQRLEAAVRHHKLTLIAAPAGSGKTVLCASLTHRDWSCAWVYLDETDDDLLQFVALLTVALHPVLEDEGKSLLNFLKIVPDLSDKIAQLVALIVNNLHPPEQKPFVLILDDYHVITQPTIHQFLAQLIDLLPDSLRLLIASRYDPSLPLARLRAQDQLAEIRLAQLRFLAQETEEFLNQRHTLNLSSADVSALQDRTEGWAAGLQLLAAVLATLPDNTDRADYIHHLSPTSSSIFDLLASEVLTHQPPDIRKFLLQTSILPDLTPDNCQAITGNPRAGQTLNRVYQRNLFLRALTPDSLDGPFRYHDLFRDFLQHRLRQEQPGQWVELHRRAVAVTVSDEQKLFHLSSADLWVEAAQLLETMAQLDNERRFTRKSVVRGIESLPEEICQSHPWLQLFVAQYYAVRGQLEAAAHWRASAAACFRATGDELGEIELLVIDAIADLSDPETLISDFREKVITARHLMRPDHWSIYHGAEQWYGIAQLDWSLVTEHTQANIQHAWQNNDPNVLSSTSLSLGPHMAFCDGGMPLIESFARRALLAAGQQNLILELCASGIMGAVRFFQGLLDEAEQYSRTSHHLLKTIGGLAWIDHHVCWVILASLLARRAYHSYDDFLIAQEPRWQTQDTAIFYRQGVMYMQGRSLWLRGRTAEAQGVLEQMQAHADPRGYDEEDNLRRLLLGSLIAISRGETGPAKRDLRQAITLHEKVRHTVMLSHPRLALATLYSLQNRWDDALDELQIVLAELKARQMPGVILQEGESIVPVLRYAIEQGIESQMLQPLLQILEPNDEIIPLPNSDDYLTARQSEVLRLLATGATNPSIATELFITERTVKAHVTRILAKLNAATRTEAVSKARQLGLI